MTVSAAPWVLPGVHLVPVRHHSPRSSAVLLALLEEVRPALVLVEGPADATPLLPVLVDPATRPPVALLAWRRDGQPGAASWPFASYSPEWVAARWAAEHGAEARFIDAPAGAFLARDELPAASEGQAAREEGAAVHLAAARARGLRSFEELWEACFEAPAHGAASFRAAILAYAELVRALAPEPVHAARDAVMAGAIAAAVADGVPAERVVVVVGAAHAAAFLQGQVDMARAADLPAPVPAALTVIPWSYPRLAEQTGYGAGNRAPRLYQRAHEAGCDFRRATLEALAGLGERLRARGFAVSLADTLEAWRLACTLATLRAKAGPGLDELREAAVATLCRGDATHVDALLWGTVVGREVGQVAARVGPGPLQEEFWREVRARRLPERDEPQQFSLQLTNPLEVGTSVFLHRLRLAGVPYAGFLGARASRGEAEEAGGLAALARVREGWLAQWTPAVDVALVEKVVLGDSLEQVVSRLLAERLLEPGGAGAAADLLLEAVVAACPEAVAGALRACEARSAADDDLPSLARACRALSGLLAYGSSRALAGPGDEALVALCQRAWQRALLRVGAACAVHDAAIGPCLAALRALHEVALAQPRVDRAGWFEAARGLVASLAPNPQASGLALGLLYLAGEVEEERVGVLLQGRISAAHAPAVVAGFLGGFLAVDALALVKSASVVGALDAWLGGLDGQRLRDALPALRRAFAALGHTERRWLLETLVRVRGLGARAGAARAVLEERDRARLDALSADLDRALGDLEDLL